MYSLDSLGVVGTAYTRDEALLIAKEYRNTGIPILGGDVYLLEKRGIKSTSDSWYCDRNKSENLNDYITRSYNVADDYIRKYPSDANCLFGFVIEDMSYEK